MTAQVLIIDPVVTTRIVLKVKLAAAYFKVRQVATLSEAIDELALYGPDLILCERALPDGDVLDLQAQIAERDIPIIALLSEDEASEQRIQMLESGIGDVICRPYDDRTLLARVRNLLRGRTAREELRIRPDTSEALGFAEAAVGFAPFARIGVIAEDEAQGKAWRRELRHEARHRIDVLTPEMLIDKYQTAPRHDALMIAISGKDPQKRLDLISTLRSRASTRQAAILALSSDANAPDAITALDIGAGDVMASGFNAKEAAIRLERLLKRRQEERRLRRSLEAGLEAAIKDPLTGLYNRRYALHYLERLAGSPQNTEREFALMLLDLDHFKRINDTHGHDVGDAVLSEFADRIRSNLRSLDLIARIGGEEFLVALPDTNLKQARRAARRICALTRDLPFACDHVEGGIFVSVSVGLVLGGNRNPPEPDGSNTHSDTIASLLRRADVALYDAKTGGRDMVRVSKRAA